MGHIHIGYDNPEELFSASIIPWFDLFVGLQLVLIDTDTQRRELYGKAGSFRFKPYGIEMRSPSNAWILEDDYIKMVYENTIKAVNMAASGEEVNEAMQNHIVNAINHSDKGTAIAIMERYDLKPFKMVENEQEQQF